MTAEADDLRHFYSETLGDSQTVTVNALAPVNSSKLAPGRYLIQFHTLVGLVTKVWCRQGTFGSVTATAASPSTPMEVNVTPRPTLRLMSRKNLDGLSFLADAGSCDVTITKISRYNN